MNEQIMVLVNEFGRLIEINPKETDENSVLVPLDGYYDVKNEQRYEIAEYNFQLKKWVGVGEQRPIIIQPISETQKIWDTLDYLMKATEIIPTE